MNTDKRFSTVYYAGKDKTSSEIVVSPLGIITISESNLQVSLQQTQLSLIGEAQTTLQISWREDGQQHVLLSHDPELLTMLSGLNVHPRTQAEIASLTAAQQRNHKKEHRRVPFYMSLIAAFFIGGYLLINLSVPLVTRMIPAEWEKQIGEYAFDNYLLSKKQINDVVVTGAVETILDRIDRYDNADLTYRVAVVDADMVNAFAFPGGYIIVTSGMIEQADAPEEIAAVLSHEIVHVLHRHGMRKLVRQAGLGILVSIVFGDISALSELIQLSSQLESLSFDRDLERDADQGGVKILQAAGISPQYMVSFFEKLHKVEDAVSGNIPEIFRTHPLTEERIQQLKNAQEPLDTFAFDLAWEGVKKAL